MDEVSETTMPPLPPTGVLRAGGIALWRQIAQRLEQDIAHGAHAPGARLPTEATFAVQFGVNRHTVRRALDELSRTGLVRVEQGRGAFVTEDVLDYAVGARTRFSEWIRRHNKEPSGEILALEEQAADAAVARGLHIRAGTRVIRYQRLGLADGRPVSLSDHFFPTARLPGLLAALRGQDSITAALRQVGVSDYRRLRSRVSARLPNAEEAGLLRNARSRPLLICENTNVDRVGAVVEFALSRYPTPRVQIVFEP